MLSLNDVCCIFISHVRAEEDYGEYHAQATHNNIGNCEEVVFATKSVGRRQYECLVAAESIYRVDILNHELICAFYKFLVDLSPELPKARQASSAHPNDKVC